MCRYIEREKERANRGHECTRGKGRERRADMSVTSSPFIDRSQQKMFKIDIILKVI